MGKPQLKQCLGHVHLLFADGKEGAPISSKEEGRKQVEALEGHADQEKEEFYDLLEDSDLLEVTSGESDLLGSLFDFLDPSGDTRKQMEAARVKTEKSDLFRKKVVRQPKVSLIRSGEERFALFTDRLEYAHLVHSHDQGVQLVTQLVKSDYLDPADYHGLLAQLAMFVDSGLASTGREPDFQRWLKFFEGEVHGEEFKVLGINIPHDRLYMEHDQITGLKTLGELCKAGLLPLEEFAPFKERITTSSLPDKVKTRVVSEHLGDGWVGEMSYRNGLAVIPLAKVYREKPAKK